MKTISRKATRKIAAIKALNLPCRVYSLRNDFHGVECKQEWAWEELYRFTFARLIDKGNGLYWITVHGNLWYELGERK